METNINIGSSQAFRLQRAVLIYGTAEHRSGFATVHDVQRPSAEANPRLGPATLVTTEFVRELAKGLGRNTILEVLPDNVLARNELVTAWWTPAAARTLFFHENTELAPITGKKFPTPALVFKIGSGGQLSVRALAESRRPERTTAPHPGVSPAAAAAPAPASPPQFSARPPGGCGMPVPGPRPTTPGK